MPVRSTNPTLRTETSRPATSPQMPCGTAVVKYL
jgi:hypothetical protein